MRLRRKKVDSSRERRALIALIVSKAYLVRASSIFDPTLIDAPHFQEVAKWCLDYWKQYKKPPGEHIEDIYHSWSEDNDNEDLVKSVHDFLNSLSQEYERADEKNIPFLLDELGDLMRMRKLHRMKDDLEYSLSKGETKEAEEAVMSFRTVNMDEGVGVNPMNNEGWDAVFADPLQPVIEFEGDAGTFFNPALTRDALVIIQATEKTGKTMWCLEFVIRALRQRRKVAFFQVGDLSQNQLYMRFGIRWSGRPLWEGQLKKIVLPDEIVFEEEDEEEEEGMPRKRGSYQVLGKRVKVPGIVTRSAVKKGIRRFRRACGLAQGVDYLKVSVHANSTMNVAGIEGILDRWLMEDGFIPDLILIDYADILCPEPSKRQHEHDRNITNDTWKALRRLSQQRHALVMVPTQSNAKAYKQKIQNMGSFSEDKRKIAHCTAMMALNRTPEEKEMGGMRINWIVLREAPYNITKPLYVGTCFALGRAFCTAKLR